MTLSEREVGELQERLRQLEHKVRNDRQMLSLLEGEVDDICSKLTALKVQVYTSIAALMTFGAVVGWAVSLMTGR